MVTSRGQGQSPGPQTLADKNEVPTKGDLRVRDKLEEPSWKGKQQSHGEAVWSELYLGG